MGHWVKKMLFQPTVARLTVLLSGYLATIGVPESTAQVITAGLSAVAMVAYDLIYDRVN